MSGIPANQNSRPRQVSARARLRPKSQLTLPEEVRRALRINEGDEVEFTVQENGKVTVRGYVSIPTDQAWLFAAHQSARQEPDEEPAAGQATMHESADALQGHLDAPGEANA
jgi:antitoxin PrlF